MLPLGCLVVEISCKPIFIQEKYGRPVIRARPQLVRSKKSEVDLSSHVVGKPRRTAVSIFKSLNNENLAEFHPPGFIVKQFLHRCRHNLDVAVRKRMGRPSSPRAGKN